MIDSLDLLENLAKALGVPVFRKHDAHFFACWPRFSCSSVVTSLVKADPYFLMKNANIPSEIRGRYLDIQGDNCFVIKCDSSIMRVYENSLDWSAKLKFFKKVMGK